ncbi:MAG TPA: glycoside hydrolase family 15 protein [Xanthobacteraceae bacterium]|nr:glycoside hydrolase family 15 protein [Xanthobacteraceae bacterium]
MPSRIEDYAIIGDCESAALVGRDGSIDWLCWPRFDSEACFAALLGTPDHGRWLIAPADAKARASRRYLPNTLILETRFESDDGAATLLDFMPIRERNPTVVRLVVGERGRLPMRLELVLRFGFGAVVPWVTRMEDGTLRAVAGPDMVVLHTPVHLKGHNLTTVGKFTISAGETVPFVLTYAPSHLAAPEPIVPQDGLKETETFWREWAAHCRPAGQWSDVVVRSLITLKALTYLPTGGIVAAPTTSLPEQFGGARNWDYRFCWLRDATLTLFTLLSAGFHNSAQAWNEWLLRAIAGSPDQIQILYGLGGERRMIEWEADWLPGYEGARPVRIGNAAQKQLQLDVYGEVMDAAHQARRNGLATHESGWEMHLELLEHLAGIWQQPDQGIWEMRGEPKHFTHSKVMAWVAFDRAIKSMEMFGFDGPIDHWRKVRAEIHDLTCSQGFDQELGSFVQYFGAKEVDASLLLLPSVGFLPIDDPRIRGTIAAIERDLLADGFVLRYRTHTGVDGLAPGEGAFLACSFWLADVYILQGRLAEAEALFKRLVSLCNDVGLLSEEYDPRSNRLAGNFPQAFSHVGLANTAFNLTQAEKPVEQRAQGGDADRAAAE